MLIVTDDHRIRAGVCPYCGLAFAAYPLIISDDPRQSVYHAACALELATDILVDFGSRWTLVTRGSYAINGSGRDQGGIVGASLSSMYTSELGSSAGDVSQEEQGTTACSASWARALVSCGSCDH